MWQSLVTMTERLLRLGCETPKCNHQFCGEKKKRFTLLQQNGTVGSAKRVLPGGRNKWHLTIKMSSIQRNWT